MDSKQSVLRLKRFNVGPNFNCKYSSLLKAWELYENKCRSLWKVLTDNIDKKEKQYTLPSLNRYCVSKLLYHF